MPLQQIKDESTVEKLAFFPVKVKKGVTVTLDDNFTTQDPSTYVCNANNKRVLYRGSDQYGLLTHRDFMGRVESSLASKGYSDFAWGPSLPKSQRTEVPHKEIFIDETGGMMRARFFIPCDKEVRSNDKLGYCLDTWNSMNGKSRESLQMGAYRFVCSNGMIGFSKSVSLFKKHTKGNFNHEDDDMTTVELQLDQLWGNFDNDLDVYRSMDSQVVSAEELEAIIQKMPLGNPDKNRKNNHFDGIRDRFWQSQFDPERRNSTEFTLWDLFNATTEHITHTVEDDQGKIENAHRLQNRIAPFFKELSDGMRSQKPLAELLA